MGGRGRISKREWTLTVLVGLLLLALAIRAIVGLSEKRLPESLERTESFGETLGHGDVEEISNTSEDEQLEKPDTVRQDSEDAATPRLEAVVSESAKQTVTEIADSRPDQQLESFGVKWRPVDFGFEKAERRARDIDTIVLHSSFNNQGGDRYVVDKVIGIWKHYGVTPHFVIDRKGNVYQLVDEENIAYHAGVSEMKDGRKSVNDFSLGVEILNAEDDEYTEAQYAAVQRLVIYLKETYLIKYVVGHDNIAPGRKTDPWNFDWKKLKIE
ncbi:MAG: N-acetylmuramoyl-L-alanine amidase [Candidatus Moranbacteria bacterium]|nr:N-acetylmuramoyl-L-alanine amidase [Candidatus Moranbacteria bacterium]